MNRYALLAVMVVHACLSGCSQGKTITLSVDAPTLTPVVQGNNQFAFDLYAKLNRAGAPNRENLFFSPFSISTALAMTYAGADGETARQMEQVLHFPYNDNKLHTSFGALLQNLTYVRPAKAGYVLNIANRLWGEERPSFKFREPFLQLNRDFYGAELEKVGFSKQPGAAADKINAWVSEQTAQKIPAIVDASMFSPETLLILTNAIYFKGRWEWEFDKAATKDQPFRLEDGAQINVPMMALKSKFLYVATDDVQVLQMPYRKNRLSMVVLLPKSPDGFAALETSLSTERLGNLMAGMREQEVQVYFPRFKMETSFELSETLQAMGMADAFTPKANFMKMIEYAGQPQGAAPIWIDSVLHKAFVDVNEEGTEAAAATAVIMTRALEMHETFRADHPFLFLIRDNATGSILFLGRVMSP